MVNSRYRQQNSAEGVVLLFGMYLAAGPEIWTSITIFQSQNGLEGNDVNSTASNSFEACFCS